MRPNLTLPVGMSFDDWTAAITVDLLAYDIPRADGLKNWRKFGHSLSGFNRIGNIPPPSLTKYPEDKDWVKWGFDVVLSADFP